MLDHGKQIKAWIRSQHLICDGTDFIFETVDQLSLIHITLPTIRSV